MIEQNATVARGMALREHTDRSVFTQTHYTGEHHEEVVSPGVYGYGFTALRDRLFKSFLSFPQGIVYRFKLRPSPMHVPQFCKDLVQEKHITSYEPLASFHDYPAIEGVMITSAGPMGGIFSVPTSAGFSDMRLEIVRRLCVNGDTRGHGATVGYGVAESHEEACRFATLDMIHAEILSKHGLLNDVRRIDVSERLPFIKQVAQDYNLEICFIALHTNGAPFGCVCFITDSQLNILGSGYAGESSSDVLLESYFKALSMLHTQRVADGKVLTTPSEIITPERVSELSCAQLISAAEFICAMSMRKGGEEQGASGLVHTVIDTAASATRGYFVVRAERAHPAHTS